MNPKDFMFLYVLVLAQRGGIGKSFVSQLVYSLLEIMKLRTIVLDADIGNSSTTTLYPEARTVDLLQATARGTILRAMGDVKDGRADCVLMDVGAGKQMQMVDLLERVCAAAKAAGIRVTWLHPLTSCNFVQTEAVKAVEIAKRYGIGLVWARQLGQGHEQRDYEHWLKTKARAAGLAYSVECDIPNASRFLVDNAASLRLSLSDVAHGRFEKLAPERRSIAEQLFTLDMQCFAADYLSDVTERLAIAISEALQRAADHEKSGGSK